MSDVKNVVKAIYDGQAKVVRESLNNVISQKASQILEAKKTTIAKTMFSESTKK